MMRFFRVFGVVTAFALALTLATPAVAGSQVPVKGTVTGLHDRVLDDPECPGYAWSFSSDGVGQMSHLGRVDYELIQCTIPVGDDLESVGTMTFTAANGDVLSVTHTMTSRLVFGPTPGPPIGFEMDGEWEADGGTGRFLNATGDGLFEGLGDIPDGLTDLGLSDGLLQLDFNGDIAYDASNRSRK